MVTSKQFSVSQFPTLKSNVIDQQADRGTKPRRARRTTWGPLFRPPASTTAAQSACSVDGRSERHADFAPDREAGTHARPSNSTMVTLPRALASTIGYTLPFWCSVFLGGTAYPAPPLSPAREELMRKAQPFMRGAQSRADARRHIVRV